MWSTAGYGRVLPGELSEGEEPHHHDSQALHCARDSPECNEEKLHQTTV